MNRIKRAAGVAGALAAVPPRFFSSDQAARSAMEPGEMPALTPSHSIS